MDSLTKLIVFAAVLVTAGANICCNSNSDCPVEGSICRGDTSCYWNPGFKYTCQRGDGVGVTTTTVPATATDDSFIDEFAELNAKVDGLIEVDERTAVEIDKLQATDTEIEKWVMDKIQQLANDTTEELVSLQDQTREVVRKLAGLMAWKRSGNVLYKCFSGEKKNYEKSENTCKQHGGILASKVLRDPTAVADILSSGCRKATWIGNKKVIDTWQWSDGGETNPATTTWGHGQPSNSQDSENCTEIMGGQNGRILMNDTKCPRSRKYICEVEL